ncbi:MAG: DUF1446 domain-containing protein [Fibrobacteres bacterium]|nr:DUF1446 domain-containing protein [Fibrobacterota bacterium]
MARGPDSVRIGNGAGFWGDNLDAPIRLAETGELDFLTLEYLAELTLSMLAHQRRRDPDAGYIPDFPETLKRLIPSLKAQPALRIVTNAGGLNPEACARVAARHLAEAGMGETRIAWITGDDLLPRLSELKAAGERFHHFDAPGREPPTAFVSANAYLGARPICEALDGGARIVITGRVADASLTVGPAMHVFGWDWEDWDMLAAASLAGHLIECGAQVTGGLRTRWRDVPDYARIGYPIAVLSRTGDCIITKPQGSGGLVDRETVTEQLLYEIGDPSAYLTPDVTLDLTGVEVDDLGRDRVKVKGAKGLPPPSTLKVSCAHANGFAAKGDLVVCGADAPEKARSCGEMIIDRVGLAGFTLARTEIELLGTEAALPGGFSPEGPFGKLAAPARATGSAGGIPPREVVLRVSAWDSRKEAIERFCREFSPIITSGPPGVTGYAGSRPKPRPVLSYWPSTVSRTRVPARVQTRSATELAAKQEAA